MLGMIVLFLTGIIACSEEKTNTTTDVAVDGRKIYLRNCVTCHGTKGDMGASGAFNLIVSELSVEERVHVITNGRNAMSSYKKVLSEAEIQAVAEYTMTLTRK